MKLFRLLSFLMVLGLMLGLAAPRSAFSQAANQPASIAQMLAADWQYSMLNKAVKAAGLGDVLDGPGPYTLFAPTNAAFARVPKAQLDALFKNPDQLKNVLLYHLVAQPLTVADMAALSSGDSVAQAPLVFTVRNTLPYVDNARIITADTQAANGVIQEIDTVLIPPSQDMVATVMANPQLKTFFSAVQAAGLVDTLKGAGPFTLFAPIDSAFSRLQPGTLSALLKNPTQLQQLVQYHILSGESFSGDVMRASAGTTLNGKDVVFNVKSRQVYVNGAHLITTDILATDGVIHLIDTVLQPPDKTIAQLIAASPNLTTLSAELKTAGMTQMLNGSDTYTLLAPTNYAFAQLPSAALKDPARLDAILSYHIIQGKLYSLDLLKTSNAQTVNGQYVTTSGRRNAVMVNNALFSVTDLLATNGVVHVFNTVLQPPEKDIYDTAAANPQIRTFVAAVQAAGLTEALKSNGPYTVFAPSDKAFTSLPAGTRAALFKDPEKLKDILHYYILSTRVFSGDLLKTPFAATTNGAELVFSSRLGQPYVNNAHVAVANILATNGVIHILDTVLLPPDKDLAGAVAANPQLRTLAAAIQANGLADLLKSQSQYTLFAPNDAAFAKLPKTTRAALLKDPAQLKALLQIQLVPGTIYSSAAAKLDGAESDNGFPLNFSVKNGRLFINQAGVVTADILATNGVIHVIDTVILPPSQ